MWATGGVKHIKLWTLHAKGEQAGTITGSVLSPSLPTVPPPLATSLPASPRCLEQPPAHCVCFFLSLVTLCACALALLPTSVSPRCRHCLPLCHLAPGKNGVYKKFEAPKAVCCMLYAPNGPSPLCALCAQMRPRKEKSAHAIAPSADLSIPFCAVLPLDAVSCVAVRGIDAQTHQRAAVHEGHVRGRHARSERGHVEQRAVIDCAEAQRGVRAVSPLVRTAVGHGTVNVNAIISGAVNANAVVSGGQCQCRLPQV